MRGGKSRTYPSFPDIETKLGYNPARFLATPDHNSIGDTSELALAQATIRGIDEIETIRAWIKVEVALGRDDDSPRQQVIAWLNQRQAALQNTGTQQTETTHETSSTETTEAPTETEDSATVDAETNGNDAVSEPTPTAATTTSAAAVATDGGEPPSTPRCPDPDCRGKLDREEIDDDEVAHWCSYCGRFKEPMDEADTVEAVA